MPRAIRRGTGEVAGNAHALLLQKNILALCRRRSQENFSPVTGIRGNDYVSPFVSLMSDNSDIAQTTPQDEGRLIHDELIPGNGYDELEVFDDMPGGFAGTPDLVRQFDERRRQMAMDAAEKTRQQKGENPPNAAVPVPARSSVSRTAK
jgi:hypothetical protein